MSKINVKVRNDYLKEVIGDKLEILESHWPLLNFELDENETINKYILVLEVVNGKLIEKRIHVNHIVGFEFERKIKLRRGNDSGF